MKIKKQDDSAICKEINCILGIMERANKSGDDVAKETQAGIVLIRVLMNEIRGGASEL